MDSVLTETANGVVQQGRITVTFQIMEDTINYWRAKCPSQGEEHVLSKEVNVLAEAYALMICTGQQEVSFYTFAQDVQDLIAHFLMGK